MIIIEITVPSVDRKYDFQLDENIPLYQLRGEICEVLCKSTGTAMTDVTIADNFILASVEQKRILDLEKTLSGNGIIEGNHLLLL